jgi:hypothetical protein
LQGQFGSMTREQAIAAGLTRDQVKARLRSGRWATMRPLVCVFQRIAGPWEQAVLAVPLAIGWAVIRVTDGMDDAEIVAVVRAVLVTAGLAVPA